MLQLSSEKYGKNNLRSSLYFGSGALWRFHECLVNLCEFFAIINFIIIKLCSIDTLCTYIIYSYKWFYIYTSLHCIYIEFLVV